MTLREFLSADERKQMAMVLASMLESVPTEVLERAIASRDFLPVAEEVIRQGEAWSAS